MSLPSISSTAEIDRFVEEYVAYMNEGNAAIFAGAGLSASAGFVDWRSLMKPIAERLGLDIHEEHDFPAIAQFEFTQAGGNRHRLNQLLVDMIGDDVAPTANHNILASLPIDTYWTTNYDGLIERSLTTCGKLPDVKISFGDLTISKPRRDAVVYKLHDDVSRASDAILTKHDYATFPKTRGAFTTAFIHDLSCKTFLFLGISFTDPNIDFVLTQMRASYGENQRQHFCVMKLRTREEGESPDFAERAARRQAHAIEDLKRFNVHTLLVDQYTAITDLLRRIDRKYRRRTVLVSGSAADFSPWDQESSEALLRNLGRALIDRGFRIVTGMGLGVANPLITGAISAVYDQGRARIDDSITMRPFPQWDAKESTVTLWKRYRQDLVSAAGIAVFLFGNKSVNGEVVLADGVREEFELAREGGLALAPVGATGSMAKSLWSTMWGDQAKYFPPADPEWLKMFSDLGAQVGSPIELLNPILDYIDLLVKE